MVSRLLRPLLVVVGPSVAGGPYSSGCQQAWGAAEAHTGELYNTMAGAVVSARWWVWTRMDILMPWTPHPRPAYALQSSHSRLVVAEYVSHGLDSFVNMWFLNWPKRDGTSVKTLADRVSWSTVGNTGSLYNNFRDLVLLEFIEDFRPFGAQFSDAVLGDWIGSTSPKLKTTRSLPRNQPGR